MLLVVLTANPPFVAGDNVLATYTAQDTGQPADVVVNVSGKVEADQFGSKKPCILEVPNAKVFAGSRVTATYELRRPNGDLVGNSITANATVTGAAPIDLLPPSLVAPAVDPVDVLAYPNGITMRIEYLAALDGDRARLAEVDPPTGSPQFPLVAFNSNKRVNTVLTPAYLAARQGKSFELRWNLNRNGGQAGKSTPTPVRVLKIADGDSRLPTPNIAANTNTVLDVEALNEGARILAVKWPVFEPAQPIWVTCKGFDNNGNPISTEVKSGEPNDSLDGLNVQAPVAWLKALKDGSALTVECAVSLDGSRDKTRAVLLPLRLYTVRAVEDLNFGAALTLNLPAYSVVRGVPPLNPPANATYTRTPTGGIKPYHFSSSNTNVALIDATTGTVRVSGRGTTTLTVTDHQNNKATYTLTTTGLKMFVRLGNLMTQPSAAQACAAAGEACRTIEQNCVRCTTPTQGQEALFKQLDGYRMTRGQMKLTPRKITIG
ncbi:Ig-like domain-containing protein [Pseudomonas sp. TH08]|uniref:Ig-like domain-containing protein n=1 Tax=Pseudomonas sp. TH08 TaxID=2796374 RepID=UPI0019142DA8|nr:Ig-like domain-containing protein [Pseudomonas sp. TH08]MBK5536265.1 Ig-like domain-containing protein [Pseudomonas sp. TH08]